MLDLNKPIGAKNGAKVRIIDTNIRMNGLMPQQHKDGIGSVLAVHDMGTYDQLYYHNKDGMLYGGNAHSPQNLVNIKTKMWRWLFVDGEKGTLHVTEDHYSEKEAQTTFKDNLIQKVDSSMKEVEEV